jgi:hypothetical protein
MIDFYFAGKKDSKIFCRFNFVFLDGFRGFLLDKLVY